MSAPRRADFIGSITKFSHLWFVFNTIFFQGFVAVTEKILEKPFCKHGKHSDQLGHRLSDKQQRIDGKGDSCPAEILCVTFYKFSFLTILKFWFSFFLKVQFHIWTKCFLGEQKVFSWWSSWWTLLFRATARPALLGDDHLGEQKCSLAELLHATFFLQIHL